MKWRVKFIFFATLCAAIGALSTVAYANAFYAICPHESHGINGWVGEVRDTREEAIADCKAHEAANEGHSCTVG